MKKIICLLLNFSLLINSLPGLATTEAIDAYRADGGTGSQEGEKFYKRQATLLASSIAGTNMFTCVPMFSTSHLIFAGGAAAFMARDIKQAEEATDYHKRKLESLKVDEAKITPPSGTITQADSDLQTAALEAAKAEEVKNKEMMQDRKENAYTSWATYTAAAVIAATEIIGAVFFIPDLLICAPIIAAPLYVAVRDAYDVKEEEVEAANADGLLGVSKERFLKLLKDETAIALSAGNLAVSNSTGRMIYFSIMADYAKDVENSLEDRINLAQENIDKLDKAILAWKNVSNGTDEGVTPGPPPTNGGNLAGPPAPTTNYLNTNTPPSPEVTRPNRCMSSSSSGTTYSSAGCANPIRVRNNLPSFHINDLNNIAKQALTYSDSVINNDPASAKIAADALAANAGRLVELRKEVLQSVNDRLKEKGQKPIDFDSLIKAKSNELEAQYDAAAAKNGFGIGQGAGSQGSAISDGTKNTNADKGEQELEDLAARSGAIIGTGTGVSGVSYGDNSSLTGNKSGMSNEEIDVVAANYDRTKGKYKPNEDDSLFEVLSKTYVRNLGKILVRKKNLDEGAASYPSEPSKP